MTSPPAPPDPAGDLPPHLLPLRTHPARDPATWARAAACGPRLTVVVDVADGRDPAYPAAMSKLHAAGVGLLGYIDLLWATRPLADLRADVDRWVGYPVRGVWLDHCPASPFSIGPVAVTVTAARRIGLTAVANPGTVPDRTYRALGVPICSFDGRWEQYRDWTGADSRPGDVHLIRGVPPDQMPAAHALARSHGAVAGVTDLPGFTGPPSWLPALAVTH